MSKKTTISGKPEDHLVVFQEKEIRRTWRNEEFVKALAARHPLRAVFRDAGFGSDSVKINIEQIFKLISPTTEVKTI